MDDLLALYAKRKTRAVSRPRRDTRVYDFDRKSSSSQEIQEWRDFLWERQGGRCPGLQGTDKDGDWTSECLVRITRDAALDHIVELQFHGHDARWNCQLLCWDCHDAKTRANRMTRAKAIAIRDRIRADPEFRPSQAAR